MNQQSDSKASSSAPVSATGKGTGRYSVWWASVLLLAGLIVTVLVACYTKSEVDSLAKQEFDFACNEIRETIVGRLNAHEQILRSGAAFYEDSDGVSRKGWHRFTERQKVQQQLPGIQGIGFALLISGEQLAQHVQEIRAEGFPDYRIRPEGKRETYSSIIYLEPFADRNLRAFGYDMLTEPVRREAMQRARDQDAAALSGKVVLVQETDKDVQAGTLMYVPVYRSGMPYETVAQRRAAIVGWAYSPYRMNDLMKGVLGGWDSERNKRIHLEIFDGDKASPETLLYDSQFAGDNEQVSASALTLHTPVDSAGRRWNLCFTQSGTLAAAVDYSKVWLVLFGGMSISLLLFGLTLALWNTQYNAKRIAQKLTAEYKRVDDTLRESEAKYRLILDHSSDLIWNLSPEGVFTYVSSSWKRVTGYEPSSILGTSFQPIVHSEDVPTCLAFLYKIIETKETLQPKAYRVRHADGSWHWHNATVTPVLGSGGEVVSIVGVSHDITERKRVESALQESEELYRAIVDNIAAGITLIDPSHTIIAVNPAQSRMFDKDAAEFVGKKCYHEFERRDAVCGHCPGIRAMTTHEPAEAETEGVRDDGSRFAVRLKVCPLFGPDGVATGFIELVEDITVQRQAEAIRQKAMDQLQKIATRVPGLVYQYRLRTDGSACLPFASEAIREIFRVGPEEVCEEASKLFANLHPDDHDGVFASIQKSARDLTPWQHEFRVKFDDGTIRALYGDAVPQREEDGSVLWHGFITDITERKLAETALREDRQRLAGIIKGTNVGTWEWNVQTGETIFNNRWAEIIGYTLEEISPVSIETWMEFSHPDDFKASNELLEKHFRGELDYYEFESRMKHKDGNWVWVLDRGKVATWMEDGKPLLMQGTHQDITERKQAEEALRKEQDYTQNIIGSMADMLVVVAPDGNRSRPGKQ